MSVHGSLRDWLQETANKAVAAKAAAMEMMDLAFISCLYYCVSICWIIWSAMVTMPFTVGWPIRLSIPSSLMQGMP